MPSSLIIPTIFWIFWNGYPNVFFPASGLLHFIDVLLVYFLVYKPISMGRFDEALLPALIIGIISLLLGGLIPGALLLLACARAKSADRLLLVASMSPQRKAPG